MATHPERMNIGVQLFLASTGGAIGVLGFAPIYFWPMEMLSIGVLFALWQRGEKPSRAFANC